MAEEETPETDAPSDAPREAEETGSAEATHPSASDDASVSDDAATTPGAEAQPQEAGEGPAAPQQPAEVLPPKERKRRAKAAKGPRRPSTPEDRDAARARKRELRKEARTRLREKRRREPAAGKTESQAEPRRRVSGRQKTRQGVVVSDRAAKTITVRIDTAHRHPRYEKIVRTSRTLHAHDERSEAHIGDTVVVRECRPLSRSKRWRLERVVERAG